MKWLVTLTMPFVTVNVFLAQALFHLGFVSLAKSIARVTMKWCRWGYRMCGRDPTELR